jgi:hypothetical protein
MFSRARNNRVDITIMVLAPAPYLTRVRILIVRLSPLILPFTERIRRGLRNMTESYNIFFHTSRFLSRLKTFRVADQLVPPSKDHENFLVFSLPEVAMYFGCIR